MERVSAVAERKATVAARIVANSGGTRMSIRNF
jgi:hypothetical protein